MTPKAHLQAARALIQDPSHWTTHEMARDIKGAPVGVFDPQAHSFCLFGALDRAYDSLGWVHSPVYGVLSEACNGEFIAKFNNTRTHQEVLAVLDLAIEKAP